MKKSYVLPIVFFAAAIFSFTACKKATLKTVQSQPDQIVFDVLAVDNDGSTTQSQLVIVKL